MAKEVEFPVLIQDYWSLGGVDQVQYCPPNKDLPRFLRVIIKVLNAQTAAEMEGREQAMHALAALKGVVPGFENARLRNFGMTIGTRDSRKIVGR